ncbi:MAG: hypothetical protein MJ252_22140 [archaeon]|nr:hypothetical protein [archaeon]
MQTVDSLLKSEPTPTPSQEEKKEEVKEEKKEEVKEEKKGEIVPMCQMIYFDYKIK